MDGDTGQWYPTKSGFAISADETASLIPLLEQASNMVAQRFTSTSQLEFNFGEINER